MCDREKCKKCPHREFEDSDIFRTSPTCQLQCKENKEHKKSKVK